MSDRVDNELRRVSTALAEVSPPKPDLSLRAGDSSRGVAGPHTLCLVDDQGLMVVVPLRIAAGVDATVSGSAFNGQTTISLPAVRSENSLPEREDLVAVGHGEGSFEVELRYNTENLPARSFQASSLPRPESLRRESSRSRAIT